jgi:hypothetical protein
VSDSVATQSLRKLNRGDNTVLTREDTRGDLRLEARFDDIDINRDGIIAPQEMQAYIAQTYGVPPAPVVAESR